MDKIINQEIIEIKLRPWKLDDINSLVNFANNYNIAKFMTDGFPFPYTQEDGIRFIENASQGNPLNIFAIEVNGQASGGIGIHPQFDIFRKNAELGYWLAEPFWGKGIVTKAVKEIIEYAFTTFDINRLFARPFNSNIASRKVLEKSGFILEARLEKTIFKHGEYLDELIYAIRR